jgi:AraC-like DNA-binding protein
MKQGEDVTAEFPGLFIIHQRIRGKDVEAHQHDDHEVFLPLKGEIRIRLANAELACGPGKQIYLPPNTPHSFVSSKTASGERLIFIVEPKAWRNYGGADGLEASAASTSQLAKELLFHLLLHPKTRGAKALIETLIQTLSEGLEIGHQGGTAGFKHLRGKTSDPRVRQCLDLIDEKWETITVDGLSAAAEISSRNLSRLFLREVALSPKQVILIRKMAQAETLLKSGRHNVTDVAFETGYQSVSQFITQFRKVTGRLPSELLR